MNLIQQAKARMAGLMRDGVTIHFVYPQRTATCSPESLLRDVIADMKDLQHAQLVRLLSSGDHAEAGRMMAQALAMAIDETCEDDVSEWLAYQAKEENAA